MRVREALSSRTNPIASASAPTARTHVASRVPCRQSARPHTIPAATRNWKNAWMKNTGEASRPAGTAAISRRAMASPTNNGTPATAHSPLLHHAREYTKTAAR